MEPAPTSPEPAPSPPRDRLATLLAHLLGLPVLLAPRFLREAAGSLLGRLVRTLLHRRRRVVAANLEVAFPEKTPVEREAIERAHFEHLGKVLLDMLLQPWFRFPSVLEAELRREGWEHLEQALAGGRSALLLCSHMGSWEICASVSTLGSVRLLSVYKRAKGFGDALLLALRRGFPQILLSKQESKRALIRGARDGSLLGLIADQGGHTRYPFFGRPTFFPDGPGHFWSKRGLTPIFCLAIRQPGGGYRCVCKPLDLPPREEIPPEERAATLVRAYIAELEGWIREYPEQYYWVHDMWRIFKDD